MDHLTAKPMYFGAQHSLSSQEVLQLEGNTKKNPFEENMEDSLCKLSLKETHEFVKALPMAMGNNNNNNNQHKYLNIDVSSSAQRIRRSNNNNNEVNSNKRNLLETPCTPGRLLSSGNVANKKCFPSKWDDAEKWLNGSNSCNDSPAHNINININNHNQNGSRIKPQGEVFAEKSRVTHEKVSKGVFITQNSLSQTGVSPSSEVVLKDKFTNKVEPIFPKLRCSDPTKEAFFFRNLEEKPVKNVVDVADVGKLRDIGTQMTPLGSSTTSRCPTPFMSTSPVRHNTPDSRSGPLALMGSEYNDPAIDIGELKECHLAKLKIDSQFDSVASFWSSREEEEEEISKSLRHFEFSNEFQKSISENKACKWEEEEKNKCCLRYQREAARIQAWVNLQSAKAEAQSKKLEVKIQKMRSDLEEKLMKRWAVVHRKAEEWRADAQFQHSSQIQKATKQAHKMVDRHTSYFLSHKSTCGCFPCNSQI